MLTGTIILAGLTGQAFVLALVYFLGIRLDAILIVMPSLVFVLTVSAGIHLIGYFGDDMSTDHNEHAAVRALRLGWKPCLLAALTTASGPYACLSGWRCLGVRLRIRAENFSGRQRRTQLRTFRSTRRVHRPTRGNAFASRAVRLIDRAGGAFLSGNGRVEC